MSPATRAIGPKRVRAEQPLFPELIRFIKPTLPSLQDVIRHYRRAYAHGFITNAALVGELEAACRERIQVGECVAVSSCTSGLALVLKALDLCGEIVLPSFTFFASAHAVAWNGLRPVFADCHPRTWTLDPQDVERRITERTSAILAEHLYGNPCDVPALETLARKYKLKLIFDSAHAFGSRYQGREVGAFGDAEVFSLSPTKLLVAGEGGLVTTNDAVLARRLRAARNYGDLGTYDPELLGLNARMSEFNASLALAGLEMMEGKVKRRNEIADLYTLKLSAVPGLRFQEIAPGNVSTFKDYSVCFEAAIFGMSRDELQRELLKENIDIRKYFYPAVHNQKLYCREYKTQAGGLPVTERIADEVLSLAIYESLPSETVCTIAHAIARLAVRTSGTGSRVC